MGSLIIGLAAGFWDSDQRKTPIALFIITGFCGGFTTFSTFSLQTIELMQKNDCPRDAANITASVAICLAFTWLGYLLAQPFKKSLLKGPTLSQFSCEPVSRNIHCTAKASVAQW